MQGILPLRPRVLHNMPSRFPTAPDQLSTASKWKVEEQEGGKFAGVTKLRVRRRRRNSVNKPGPGPQMPFYYAERPDDG